MVFVKLMIFQDWFNGKLFQVLLKEIRKKNKRNIKEKRENFLRNLKEIFDQILQIIYVALHKYFPLIVFRISKTYLKISWKLIQFTARILWTVWFSVGKTLKIKDFPLCEILRKFLAKFRKLFTIIYAPSEFLTVCTVCCMEIMDFLGKQWRAKIFSLIFQ